MTDDDPNRTLPVEPTVHVESFATHDTVTWKAGPLSRFVDAIREHVALPEAVTAVVDRTDTAGRRRLPIEELRPGRSVRYVRIEPDADWSASWERRTSPTVSVSGAPPPELCRALHCRTTECDAWPAGAEGTLRGLVGDGS